MFLLPLLFLLFIIILLVIDQAPGSPALHYPHRVPGVLLSPCALMHHVHRPLSSLSLLSMESTSPHADPDPSFHLSFSWTGDTPEKQNQTTQLLPHHKRLCFYPSIYHWSFFAYFCLFVVCLST
jgi:hypothetical protein